MDVTRGFPLLSAPSIVFDNLQRFFGFLDLIHIANLSKRCEILVQNSVKRCKKEVQVSVSMDQKSCSLRIEGQSRKSFTWESNEKIGYWDEEVFVDRRIGDVVWEFISFHGGYKSIKPLNLQDLIFWLKYLKTFRNFRISYLELDFPEGTFPMLFQETTLLHKADQVHLSSVKLTQDQMTYFLDHIVANDLYSLARIQGEGFQYPKSISYDKLHLDADWITMEKLSDMMKTCRQITLFSRAFSNQEINTLLKSWLESDNTKLELLYLTMTSGQDMAIPDLDYDEIYDGIECFEGSKKVVEGLEYFNPEFAYENGDDIQRQDGLWATVILEKPTIFKCEMMFVVWHNQRFFDLVVE